MSSLFSNLYKLLGLCVCIPFGCLLLITTHIFSCVVDIVNLPLNILQYMEGDLEEEE
jgi:hypothetical protein